MARKILRRTILVVLWVVFTAGGCLSIVFFTSPDPQILSRYDPPTTAFIERAREAGLEVEWMPVAYEEISTDLKLAIVVAEDLRFFTHDGFDRIEARAAVGEALRGKRLRGASTITQQLARNLWLSNRRTPLRKLREAVLTVKLERELSKKRIFHLYLNTAIFGRDIVGVEAAAQHYFGVSAAEVSATQSALLAATLPAPTKWYPGSDSPRAARHSARILDRMNWPTGLRERL